MPGVSHGRLQRQVGGHDRGTASRKMLAQQGLQQGAALRIECGAGFVHEPYRPMRPHAGQGKACQLQALLLTLRQPSRLDVALTLQTDTGQGLFEGRLGRGADLLA